MRVVLFLDKIRVFGEEFEREYESIEDVLKDIAGKVVIGFYDQSIFFRQYILPQMSKREISFVVNGEIEREFPEGKKGYVWVWYEGDRFIEEDIQKVRVIAVIIPRDVFSKYMKYVSVMRENGIKPVLLTPVNFLLGFASKSIVSFLVIEDKLFASFSLGGKLIFMRAIQFFGDPYYEIERTLTFISSKYGINPGRPKIFSSKKINFDGDIFPIDVFIRNIISEKRIKVPDFLEKESFTDIVRKYSPIVLKWGNIGLAVSLFIQIAFFSKEYISSFGRRKELEEIQKRISRITQETRRISSEIGLSPEEIVLSKAVQDILSPEISIKGITLLISERIPKNVKVDEISFSKAGGKWEVVVRGNFKVKRAIDINQEFKKIQDEIKNVFPKVSFSSPSPRVGEGEVIVDFNFKTEIEEGM